MVDRIESFKTICQGGLNSNEFHIGLAETEPGAATRLVNYEPSLYGGYRRINGYSYFDGDYPEVGAGSAEGAVLCVAYYQNNVIGDPYVIAARKDTSGNTYTFYKHTAGVGWQAITTGATQSTTDGTYTVDKIRHVQFNFGAHSWIAFVDGINGAILFDGTNWYQLDSANTGGTGSPGGDQTVDAPLVVEVFENHLFLAADRGANNIVAYSAPNDPLTWTTAAGSGQLTAGFPVVTLKPFRDSLFIFGPNSIKKAIADVDAGFITENVTSNVGCIARDSVQEIGGDLIFLSPDGLRPVAGTSRIGDVEIATISRPIQGRLLDFIANNDLHTLNSVVVRSKSQYRMFVGDTGTATLNSIGILGGLTASDEAVQWEFSELVGIRASCTTSEYVGAEEYVLHGDYDGNVYRQEQGNTFNGSDVVSIFSTPYLDFGDTEVRKVLHRVNVFFRAEGTFTTDLAVEYDWGDANAANPLDYVITGEGSPVVWGGREIVYGGAGIVYGGNNRPVSFTNIQGSGYSVRLTFVTYGNYAPHSVQGIVYEFGTSGRR